MLINVSPFLSPMRFRASIIVARALGASTPEFASCPATEFTKITAGAVPLSPPLPLRRSSTVIFTVSAPCETGTSSLPVSGEASSSSDILGIAVSEEERIAALGHERIAVFSEDGLGEIDEEADPVVGRSQLQDEAFELVSPFSGEGDEVAEGLASDVEEVRPKDGIRWQGRCHSAREVEIHEVGRCTDQRGPADGFGLATLSEGLSALGLAE